MGCGQDPQKKHIEVNRLVFFPFWLKCPSLRLHGERILYSSRAASSCLSIKCQKILEKYLLKLPKAQSV